MSEKKLIQMVADAKARPLTRRCPQCKREFPEDDKMWTKGKDVCKLCEIIGEKPKKSKQPKDNV
jgi:formylmethanofuran dehydrogenase subunit E